MRKKYLIRVVAALLLSLFQSPALAKPLDPVVEGWKVEWPKTDFSRHSVDLKDFISGGPARDGIPPIDNPRFVSPLQAEEWLAPREPVLVFRHGGEVRAYPLQILIWHEIVNDRVGGLPIVVTFCPLCNSALVFERRVKGRELTFGTTGKLRISDLVMWDRQSESWWQQLTGEAVVGELTGETLTFLPAPLVSFETFRGAYPKGRVLSRETGFYRGYGDNPYVGYDQPGNQPFLLRRPADRRLPAMERVVALEAGGHAKAYPYGELIKAGGADGGKANGSAVNDTVGGEEIVIFYSGGTRSALDNRRIGSSRDVGAAAVYSRKLAGRLLTFEARRGKLVDLETGSLWDLLGRAVEGELKGSRLTPVVHANHFAFAWLAFRPDSAIWKVP